MSIDGKSQQKCLCVCGTPSVVRSRGLLTGRTRSCGCLKAKSLSVANTLHGQSSGKSRTKIYRAWLNVKNRCFNQRTASFKYYGAAGLSMYLPWANSFELFSQALGEPPTSRHSLDRVDNCKGYFPGNVRWATSKEQSRNRSDNRFLTYRGVTKCLDDWAEFLGVNKGVLNYRLDQGWSVEKALNQPVRGSSK